MIMDKKVLVFLKWYLLFLWGFSFVWFNWWGFEIVERYKLYYELGDVYMVLIFGKNWLYFGDFDLVMEMFKRWNDFLRCLKLMGKFEKFWMLSWVDVNWGFVEFLNVFGINLGIVDVVEWKW